MNYEEAMQYIHGTLKFGSKLGLENITRLLDLMGNPHKNLKFVHVAGTNGKGSTTAFISQILIESGYRTGIFTSPYIQRFTERIKIDDIEIKPDELAELVGFVKAKVDLMLDMGLNHPTEFEIVTAVALEYYHRNKCDIVVLEVGLGGRFDSTNVIDTPEVAVITTISLDHTDRLGGTLAEIAFQKAGIIKPGGTAVIYPQKSEAEKVFVEVCENVKANIHLVDLKTVKLNKFGIEGQQFDYKSYHNLETKLLGDHQLNNAAVAIDACEVLINKGFKIDHNNIRTGIANARWPGRLEIINSKPLVLIDGAHNLEGGQSLNTALDKYFDDRSKIFIVGFLRDKDYHHIMEMLAHKAKLIITVTPNTDRAIPSAELAGILQKYTRDVKDGVNIRNALQIAFDNADANSIICAFGSLYMIGDIREAFI